MMSWMHRHDGCSVISRVYNSHTLGVLLSTLIRTFHIELYCYPTSFPSSLLHNWGIYHIVHCWYQSVSFVISHNCTTVVEAALFRFDPRDRLSWDVKVLIKTHIIFYKGLHRQVNVRSAHSANYYLRSWPLLQIGVARKKGAGSCNRMDIGWPTE